MITCPYCATEVQIMTGGPFKDHAKCSYCDILLGPDSEHGMYSKDGIRMSHLKRANMITEDDAKLSLTQMKQLHTLDLLLVLKIAREQRAVVYNLMRVFNRATEQAEDNSSYGQHQENEKEKWGDMANNTGKEYEYWTRRCWMIENLLFERLGYFPEKVNEELYGKFVHHNARSMKKAMRISKEKKKRG